MGRTLWIIFNAGMSVWTLSWLFFLADETHQGYYEIVREHREVGQFPNEPKPQRQRPIPQPTQTYTETGQIIGIESGVRTTLWTNAGGSGSYGFVDRLTLIPSAFPRRVVGVSTIVWLIALAMRFWPRRRVGAGCCAACGYDLRATPGRCPECGAMTLLRHEASLDAPGEPGG